MAAVQEKETGEINFSNYFIDLIYKKYFNNVININIIDKIVYLFPTVFKIQCMFYIYNTSPF